jgi:protocatechuate 3,4-dioxygenase alpha subunit
MTNAWENLGIAPQVSNWSEPARPTPSQTIGPYFEIGLSWMGLGGAQLVPPASASAVTLTGQVLDGAVEPVLEAVVEIWQADEHGRVGAREGFTGWGRSLVDGSGTYRFTTVRPGPVGDAAAPYIAVNLFLRGSLQRLVTRIYIPGHPANGDDPLLSSLEHDRRATLVAEVRGDELHHDFRLQGDRETVFLVW